MRATTSAADARPDTTEAQGESRLLISAMVGTFVVMRVWLAMTPNADLTIAGINIHHLFTGILVATAAAIPLALNVARRRSRKALIVAFGVGIALVLDEWVYLIVTDGTNASYATPASFWGGVAAIVISSVYAQLCARAARRRVNPPQDRRPPMPRRGPVRREQPRSGLDRR